MPIIVFLRGVNVGGHRAFRPSLLAKQLEEYGVVNIGAAGTLVVRRPVTQARLRSEILRCLPFETEVITCTSRELIAAVGGDPFAGVPAHAEIVRFVSVLAKRPQASPPVPLGLPESGNWFLKVLSVRGRFVFGVYRRKMQAIRYLGALDRVFGAAATTRNWNTISAILKALPKRGGPYSRTDAGRLSRRAMETCRESRLRTRLPACTRVVIPNPPRFLRG
jgi:uncharacterized protein (DUF1697 family)